MRARRGRWPGRRDWLGIAALLACGLAAAATSPFRVVHPRSYPAWRLGGVTHRTVEQTHLDVWVSKSGKTGVGITVRAERCGATPPTLAVKRLEWQVHGTKERYVGKPARVVEPPRPVRKTKGPAEPPPPHVTRRFLYVAVPFDNEALWNAGRNEGQLLLELELEGRPLTLTLPAQQSRKGLHRSLPFGAPPPCESEPSRCPAPAAPDAGPASAPASAPVLEPVDAGGAQ